MKISLEWLSDFLPGPIDAQQAADALTMGGFPVESIETHGSDTVLDVEVTSNRGDCLSHIGVARELAALLNREFKLKNALPAAKEGTPPTSVTIDVPSLCPHYTARVLRNVSIKPSPAWLVRRLEAVGVRAINNVVDVTNYVMFELGQPLHAFDLDRLTDHKIVVRQARPGEKLVSIDGRERTLLPEMLVIADAARPVALAGVMGGVDSEVSNATQNVLLESARFESLSVRKTARRLAMKSDSSYRFERGIDPLLPERASLRAAQLILETAGGELLPGVASAGATGYTAKAPTLRLPRMARLLGIEFAAAQVVDALKRLQLQPTLNGDSIDVAVPSHRLDLNIESDLIEEAARVIGYEKVPVREEISIRLSAPEPSAHTISQTRSILVGSGFFESVTFGWVSDALAGDFTPAEAAGLPRAHAAVRKADASLRPSIIPGLLESLRRNENAGVADARLFEIGSTFILNSQQQVDERRKVALVGGTDLRDVRGVIELILNRLNPDREVRIVAAPRAGFGKAASGRIEWDGQVVGYLGKIDRAVTDKLGLREIPAAAELELLPLVEGSLLIPTQKPIPQFPTVRRDLSLVIPEATAFERIAGLIRGLKLEQLEDVEYITTYRGKPLEPGTKSVTVTFVFRSQTGTLTSEQVDAAIARVVSAAQQQLSATLRA